MKLNQVILLGCLGAAVMRTGDVRAQSVASTQPDATAPIKVYADATRSLYNQVLASVVRVRIDQSPELLIPPAMRKEYANWRENLIKRGSSTMPADGGPAVIRIEPKRDGMPEMRPGDMPPMPPPNEEEPGGKNHSGAPGGDNRAAVTRNRNEMTTAAMMGDSYVLVRRFLEQRMQRVQDPETAARIRQSLMRVESLRGEQSSDVAGVVIDSEGRILLMTALFRERDEKTPREEKPLKVFGSDGTEYSATFAGADYVRGFSILKLKDVSTLAMPPALEVARTRPLSGELLMCLSAGNGAVSWVTVPSPSMAPRKGDERFAVGAEERSSFFLFSIDGRLAAVGNERLALPISAIKQEISEVTTKGYVSRRQFGVRHTPVGIDSPLRKISALGHRPAVRVDEVLKNSLAEKAGLKKGDIILSIDNRPIVQLPRILQDLSTRSGETKIGIIRDEKEIELTLTLDNK